MTTAQCAVQACPVCTAALHAGGDPTAPASHRCPLHPAQVLQTYCRTCRSTLGGLSTTPKKQAAARRNLATARAAKVQARRTP